MAALLVFAPAASAQDDMTVSIQDFSFDPGQITVAPGTTVTWTNEGPSPHTTTADDGSWDSGTLQQGEDFSFTFDEPGTYTYHCSIHPDMTASVKVSGGGGGGGTTPSTSASMSASMSPPQDLTETGGISLPLVAALALAGGGIVAVVAMRRAS